MIYAAVRFRGDSKKIDNKMLRIIVIVLARVSVML